MKSQTQSRHVKCILFAEDDPDDRLLMKEALNEATFSCQNIKYVENGEELMDYLRHKGKFVNHENWCMPDLILLDLNMPKKDGREALKEIKSDILLRGIPVIVFTTSTAPNDIAESYAIGANTYMAKADNFEEMVSAIKTIKQYWSDYALLS